MSKEVIVFGASGFIGTRLVARAVGMGVHVVAVDIAPPRIRLDGVDYRQGDVRNPLPVEMASPNAAIYNLAAIHRTPGHPPHEYYETNVLGALNVTRLAREVGVETIVFTSSISVYGPDEDVVDEESILKPTSDYGRSKVMAENIHRNWRAEGRDRRLIVVRPGVIFGPGEGGNFTNMAQALRRGLFAYPGRKGTIKSAGSVDELLNALDFAFSNESADITFNLAYPEEYTTEDIVKAFGQVADIKTDYPVVPIQLLLAAAGGFEILNALGLKNPIHRERIWKLVNSTRVRPGWLVANNYAFSTDLVSALGAWSAETRGAFK